MDSYKALDLISSSLRPYSAHILIFLFVVFVGLTFAHPQLLLNDEWITVNQLHQLHDGHQVIVNEGKYGFYNGTMNVYFAARGNMLAYSLFLPLLSLPAFWLIDILGNHFVFFILYLWTFIFLILILVLHFPLSQYRYVGKYRWTPAAFAGIFILFFLNLLYYVPFSVTGSDTYPEVLAVVFTNILLLGIAGALTYEINRTLFGDPVFSFFGTVVCLCSSSYIFWSSGCKDHILTLLLFVSVLFCVVKFRYSEDTLYLPLAFLVTGLLAWARPELALWVCIFIGGMWGFILINHLRKKTDTGYGLLLCSPLFTAIGALPFFLNNYLVTKNPLLPTGVVYIPRDSASVVAQATNYGYQNSSIPSPSLVQIFTLKNAVPSSDLFGDIVGILFHPANGSMGLLPVVPLLLVMLGLAIVLVVSKKIRFSQEEIYTIVIIGLLTIPVGIAYANNLVQLNTSRGITPDIRYLSPLYIPLTLLGLFLMRKIFVTDPIEILKKILIISAIGIPVSLYLTAKAYTDPTIVVQLDAPISTVFSSVIFSVAIVSLVVFFVSKFSEIREKIVGLLIALLCAVPFIWQIDISVRFWLFSVTSEKYQAWIPIVNIIYAYCSSPLFIR
jgi:hypothetical protein